MLTPSNLSKPAPSQSLGDIPRTSATAGIPVDVSMSFTGTPLAPKATMVWLAVTAAAVVAAVGFGIVAWRSGPRSDDERQLAAAPPPVAMAVAPTPAPPPLVAVTVPTPPTAAPAAAPPILAPPQRDPEAAAPAPPAPVARHEKHHEPAAHRHTSYEPALSNSVQPAPKRTIVVARTMESRPAEATGPMGSLVVNTDPWSRVSIDGRDFGQTPLPGVPLKPGRHELVCTPESGPVHRETVVIAPGQRVKRLINLAGGE